MASSAKHTAGPVSATGEIHDVSGHQLWCGRVEPSVAVGGCRGAIANIQSAAHIGGISNDEAAANAALIAETFTITHEIGLTPRQLAERCGTLEAALLSVADEAKKANAVIALHRAGRGQGRVRVTTAMHRIERVARAAIAKAEGGAT